MQFVYAVMMDNGVVKFGRTLQLYERLSHHCNTSSSMGVSIDVVMVAMVKDMAEAEKRITREARSVMECHHGSEYFKYKSQDQVTNLFDNVTGGHIKFSVIRDGSSVRINLINDSYRAVTRHLARKYKSSDDAYEDAIMHHIRVEKTITLGVLCSKLRRMNRDRITTTVDALVERRVIDKDVTRHKKNGSEIIKLSIRNTS